jgi:hypothetical protein
MKTTLLRIVLILGLATLVFALFGTRKLKAGDPTESPRAGLIIASDIPEDKWREIKKILSAKPSVSGASPRRELYRIRVYKTNGHYTPMGALPEKMLVWDFPESVSGFKGHVIQIGVGAVEDVDYYPSPDAIPKTKVSQGRDAGPTPSATPVISLHSRSQLRDSKKMEQEVNKVVAESEASPSPSATPLFSLHFRANIEESKNMIREVNKVLNSPDAASSPKP